MNSKSEKHCENCLKLLTCRDDFVVVGNVSFKSYCKNCYADFTLFKRCLITRIDDLYFIFAAIVMTLHLFYSFYVFTINPPKDMQTLSVFYQIVTVLVLLLLYSRASYSVVVLAYCMSAIKLAEFQGDIVGTIGSGLYFAVFLWLIWRAKYYQYKEFGDLYA